MLAALEAKVSCCGVVGDDAAGDELRQLLVAAEVDCDGDPRRHRSAHVGQRTIHRPGRQPPPHQILRVDREKCDPLSTASKTRLIERLAAQVPRHDALLISDYGKGVCTPRLLKASIEAANRAGVPVMVDPSRTCAARALSRRDGDQAQPPGNRTGHRAARSSTPADALAAGRQLCRDLDAQHGPDHARPRRHDAGRTRRQRARSFRPTPGPCTTSPAPATW